MSDRNQYMPPTKTGEGCPHEIAVVEFRNHCWDVIALAAEEMRREAIGHSDSDDNASDES